MKKFFYFFLISFLLTIFPKYNYCQAPNLGYSSSFAMFTVAGALSTTSSTIRGDIGTKVGAYTGSPALYGTAYIADTFADKVAIDVISAYTQLTNVACDSLIGTTLGNNQVLKSFVYCTNAASTINGKLIFDADGNPNAIFIVKINGALETAVSSEIVLINGASLCNIYWQVNGAFSLESNSIFRGTLIASGAISLFSNATLIGKAMTTAGAIALQDNLVAKGVIPIVNITGGKDTLCLGDSFVLTANISVGNAPYTYDWASISDSTSTITVKPSTYTPFKVTVSSFDGCMAAEAIFDDWIFCDTNSLPVELISFYARLLPDNHVFLEWITASEVDNDYFLIERSYDATKWLSIGKVDGNGNSNRIIRYNFLDNKLDIFSNPSIYYRLKQIDFDGTFYYSEIKNIQISNREKTEMKIYYQTVLDRVVLDIINNKKENIVVIVLDVSGKVLQQQTIECNEGNNIHYIDLFAYPKGIYLINVLVGEERINQKIVKW